VFFANLLVPLKKLQLTPFHPLHLRDDHNPSISNAVIVPVVNRTQGTWGAQINLPMKILEDTRIGAKLSHLRRVAEAEVWEDRFPHTLLEHGQKLWAGLQGSDEWGAVVQTTQSTLGPSGRGNSSGNMVGRLPWLSSLPVLLPPHDTPHHSDPLL